MLRGLSGVKAVKVDLSGGAAYVAIDPKAKLGGEDVAQAFNGLNDGRHQFKATTTQTKNLWLTVTGMSKDKDAQKVAKGLEKVKGVKAALVDARAGSAVVFMGEPIKPETLIATVTKAGAFRATLGTPAETKKE